MSGLLGVLSKAAATVAAASAATTAAVVPRNGYGLVSLTASAHSPVITAFFPQILDADLIVSVIGVQNGLTTMSMCPVEACDAIGWTYLYGPSTAVIKMTASQE